MAKNALSKEQHWTAPRKIVNTTVSKLSQIYDPVWAIWNAIVVVVVIAVLLQIKYSQQRTSQCPRKNDMVAVGWLVI